jgi:hypothetical protein
MGCVRLSVGYVHAGNAADVQPVARERQRRALADLHAEQVAVEVPGRVDVVAEHQQVLESPQRHRSMLPARAYPDAAVAGT